MYDHQDRERWLVAIKRKCRHKWGDIAAGVRTGQCERQCQRCAAYQHTYKYFDGKWLDGPMLSEDVFDAYSQGYADGYNKMEPGL